MNKLTVLFVVHDPGCMSALRNIYYYLGDDLNKYFYIHKCSQPLLKTNDLTIKVLKSENIQTIINNICPDIVVAGTSMEHDAIDKQFISLARNKGIKTIAFVDYWANYKKRFTNNNGEITSIPDFIAVLDSEMKNEITKIVGNKTNIIITGHPGLDGINKLHDTVRMKDKNLIKIVFISEPIFEGLLKKKIKSYEFYAIEMIQNAIDGIVRKDRNIRLYVRLHPKEKIGKYREYMVDEVDKYIEIEKVCKDADIIVGLSSAVLMTSFLMGRHTISINNPNNNKFVLTRDKYIPVVNDVDELIKNITDYIEGNVEEVEPSLTWLADGKSTEIFANLILQ